MKDGRQQEGRVHFVETELAVANEVVELRSKLGENFMMRKLLLHSRKEVEMDQEQRNTLFKRKRNARLKESVII